MTDEKVGVTGRDGYIVGKALAIANSLWSSKEPPKDRNLIVACALYTALKHLQSLPNKQRAWSDEQDMEALLAARYPDFLKMVLTDETPAERCDEKAEQEDEPKPNVTR